MADIRHNVVIKTTPEKVYEVITTQQGLSGWWAKQTIAKPEVGFVNIFTFGTFQNKMKIISLKPNIEVKWECVDSIEEWVGTYISFSLEEKEENTLLRFTHGDWREVTDMFASCTYDWGRFLGSLKSLCETGVGSPS